MKIGKCPKTSQEVRAEYNSFMYGWRVIREDGAYLYDFNQYNLGVFYDEIEFIHTGAQYFGDVVECRAVFSKYCSQFGSCHNWLEEGF